MLKIMFIENIMIMKVNLTKLSEVTHTSDPIN